MSDRINFSLTLDDADDVLDALEYFLAAYPGKDEDGASAEEVRRYTDVDRITARLNGLREA